MIYHKEVHIPEKIKNLNAVTLTLEHTHHARQAAQSDRYGEIPLPDTLKFRGKHICEAQVEGGKLIKLVVRKSFNNELDMSYVLLIQNSKHATLKTVWLNRKSDQHRTLNTATYNNGLGRTNKNFSCLSH